MALRGGFLITCIGLSFIGCEPGYPAHPIAEFPPGATRRVGCVEISIEAERDASLPSTSLLAQFRLKNVCNDPALVDLNAMTMWADRKNGDHFELSFYDPRREIVPLHIETHGEGIEKLQVDSAGVPGSLRQICFDPSRISDQARHAGAICYLFDHERIAGEDAPQEASSEGEEQP